MSERVLLGPFLTRAHAAARAGLPSNVLRHRPDLLRVPGRWLPEVYFAFQFDESGIRRDIGRVVVQLRTRFEDVEIADWLVTPNPELHGATPLRSLNAHRDPDRVIAAAEVAGPTSEAPPRAPGTGATGVDEPVSSRPRAKRPARRRHMGRPAVSH